MSCRVALVGGGWVAERVWRPRLEVHDAFAVAAVVDPDESVAARFDGVAWFPSLGDLPTDAADLALIAAPNRLHAALSIDALDRGMAVFVEKPPCLTLDELDAIAAAAEVAGRPVVVSGASRLRSDVQALHGLVSGGQLGKVERVEVGWVRSRGIPRAGGWFTNRDLAGGGALFDLGWHLADIALWFAGWPEVMQAAGRAASAFLGSREWGADWRMDAARQRLPIDVEDTFVGFATTTGPAIALHVAWASHEPLDVTTIAVDGVDAVATLRTTFGFSPNRVERPSLTVRRRGVVEDVPLPDAALGDEYDLALDDVAAQLRAPGGDHSLVEARSTLSLVLALYAAASS